MFRVRTFESRTLSWWYNERKNIDMNPQYQRKGGLWSADDKALLIDPRSEDTFRAAVLTLAKDTGLRENLGRAARQSAVKRGFTWLENGRRLSRLYEQEFSS